MSTLKLGSLFSGYGGLDLAVHEAFGDVETAWVSDIEPGPCKVLAHRFPDAPNLGDITKVDWSQVEPVDIIAGGSPCQDLSMAGRRAGMKPGTRSGLWENMREAIAQLQPTHVVWENVRGALNAEAKSASTMEHGSGLVGTSERDKPALRALGRLLGDLTDLGYDAGWETVRASDIGAPHQRERVFLLAQRAEAPADPNRLGYERRVRTTRSVPREKHEIETSVLAPILDVSRYEGRERSTATRIWVDIMGYIPQHLVESTDGLYPLPSRYFYEWMMGLPEGWITDVPGVTNGEAVRMCGNGVVPAQGSLALNILLERFNNENRYGH